MITSSVMMSVFLMIIVPFDRRFLIYFIPSLLISILWPVILCIFIIAIGLTLIIIRGLDKWFKGEV